MTLDATETLPAAVRRYLDHALPAPTPRPTAVRLVMHGEIRLQKRWRPFEADEWLAPHRGFEWRATVHMGAITMRGFDRYQDGRGEMRWKAWGLLPLIHSQGPDIDRSARGRVMVEAAFVPGALLPEHSVRWTVDGAGLLHARWALDGIEDEVAFEIDAAGRPVTVRTLRWGDPDGKGPRLLPFGARFATERDYHGMLLPETVSVGWWFGTERYEPEGEFFRAVVDDVLPA